MRLRRLFSDVAVYGISSVVGRLLNYLLTPLYVRVFLPSEYGVMVELYAYLAFLNVLYSWGMETSFFHFSSGGRHRPDRVLSSAWVWTVGLATVGGVLLWWNVPSLDRILAYGGREGLLRAAVLVAWLDAIAVLPFSWLRKFGYSIRFSLIRLGGVVVSILLNLLWLYFFPRWGVHPSWLPWEGSVELVLLANVVGSAFSVAFLGPVIWRHWAGVDWGLLRRMIAYGAPLMVAGLAGMINETADRPLLKWLLPGAMEDRYHQLGIYGANYKVAVLMVLFLQAFRYAAEPFFLEAAHRREGRGQFARLLLVYVAAMGVVFVGVILNLHWIKFFIGPEGSPYHAGLGVVPIVMAAFIFLGVYYHLSVWYKHLERTAAGMWMALGGAVITLAANGMLIPYIGIYGAAVATLLSYGGMMLLSAVWGRRHFRVPYPWGVMSAVLGLGMGVSALAWWWEGAEFVHFEWRRLVIHNMAGLGVGGVMIWLTYRAYHRLLRREQRAVK